MPDPRRRTISAGTLSLRPAEVPERWGVGAAADDLTVEASWGDWVRLARRVLDADAQSRDLEARGDAWDQGHAAGVTDAGDGSTQNPFR